MAKPWQSHGIANRRKPSWLEPISLPPFARAKKLMAKSWQSHGNVMAFENGKETGMPRKPISTTQNTPKQDEPEVSQPKREISQTSSLGEKLPKARTSDQGQDFAIQAVAQASPNSKIRLHGSHAINSYTDHRPAGGCSPAARAF